MPRFKARSVLAVPLALAALLAATTGAGAQTLQRLANPPPQPLIYGFLMTDGSVVFQGGSVYQFFKLTPDASGSYVNGTWSQVATLPRDYGPYANGSAVLADGRLLFVGGEYLVNAADTALVFKLTAKSAIFDPVANSWTEIAPPAHWGFIGDSPTIVLPDGKVMVGQKVTRRGAVLDPATLTWTEISFAGKNDVNAEEGWTLMPDGSILTVDLTNWPAAERFIPSIDPALGHWITAGRTPVDLTSPPVECCIHYGQHHVYHPPGEIGPAILRPDGTVFATGSLPYAKPAGPTAIYQPGTLPSDPGTWTLGPSFQTGDNAGDSYAVLLPSGNVLVESTTSAQLPVPTEIPLPQVAGAGAAEAMAMAQGGPAFKLYEFDGTNFNITVDLKTAGQPSLLMLPTGEVMIGGDMIYQPTGSYDPSWAPAILKAPAKVTAGGTYPIYGTQFNGVSQAYSFGDEFSNATNYPLVRITNTASGHVVYARTHDHSTMGVATGSAVVSTSFDVPAGIETGASQLVVVANGIPSVPVPVMVK